MAYTLVVNEEAQDDALEAYLYYEDRLAGLGERFLKELTLRYQLITENPQHYSYLHEDKEKTLRRVKIKHFPFLVVYDFTETEVIVYTVHNCYKKP